MNDFLVSEVFGPTLQGEGPSAGIPAAFIRLGLCNLNCTFCDTPYTWDWNGQNGDPQDRSAVVRMSESELLVKVIVINRPTVVITGGEPLIQQAQLGPLVERIRGTQMRVEVETNGTITPNDLMLAGVSQWNVSPKLPNSGVAKDRAWKTDPIRSLVMSGRAIFKFVCQTVADVELVAELAREFGIRRDLVWIMPEGTDAETIVRTTAELADAVVARRFNLTTRLHVLAWGNERAK